MSAPHVVVVGGGMTGLAAAYHLERRSQDARVTLVERDGRLGGKVATEVVDGCLLDTGPDSFLAQKPWALELCRELGIEGEVIRPLQRRFHLLIGGRLHAVPHELVALVPSKPEALWKASFLSLPGKARASMEGLVRPRRDEEDESLASFMRRRFGREFALRFAEPLMGGVHAGDPQRMSMASVYPLYWGMECEHGSMTKALLAMRLAARRKGAPPAGSPFVALRSGMASLVMRTAAALQRTDVRLGVGVRSIEPAPSGCLRLALAGGESLEADAVVLAIPAFDAAALVEPWAPRAAPMLRDIPYASTAVVSLAYRVECLARQLDGTGFLAPREGALAHGAGEPLPITGCTWSSAKWEGRAPEGIVLMRAFVGYAGRDREVREHSEAELAEKAHRALAALLGIGGEPVLRRVHRWIDSMPQYEVGHGERLRRIEEGLSGQPSVVLAGSAYRGVGLPDCVRQGREAADRALAACVSEGQRAAEAPRR